MELGDKLASDLLRGLGKPQCPKLESYDSCRIAILGVGAAQTLDRATVMIL